MKSGVTQGRLHIRGYEGLLGRDWLAIAPSGTGVIHTNPLCHNIVFALVTGKAIEADSLEELTRKVERRWGIGRYRWCQPCASQEK